MFGYENPEDLIGLDIIDTMVAPSEGDRVRSIYYSRLEGQAEPERYEMQGVCKNGETIWLEVFGSLTQWEGIQGGQGVLIDITERKRAEEKLSASEENYRLLFSNMRSGFAVHEIVVDENHKPVDYIFLEVNDAFESLTGLKRADLIGRKATEVLPGIQNDPADWVAKYGIVALTGEEIRFEQYAEPLKKWFSVYAFRQRAKQFAVIFEDITDRKKAEEAVEESEAKYRQVVETALDAIFITDIQGYFVDVNPMACKMTGYQRDELIGLRFLEMTGTDEIEKNRVGFEQLGSKGSLFIEFQRAKRKDGTFFPAELNAVTMADGRVLGILRDTSERKQLEAQLQQAQKMESVGTLAGGIAHNFNNLLQVIMGNTSRLLSETEPSHPHHKILTTINSRVEKGSELTSQLLDFARGGMYQVKPTNLSMLLLRTSYLFGSAHGGISIHKELETELWLSRVDQKQIEQVLLNLFVNSQEAMPHGGELFVKSENVTLDETFSKIYEVMPGRYVKMSVRDTGTGMDQETLGRIFEPFFTTKEMATGSGLGLASAYGIIKNHGGIISVDSEVGKGTTFDIYLPATDERIVGNKVETKEELEGAGTILFVDDDEDLIDLGRGVLKMLGYEVLSAGSGKEALEVYEKNRGGVVLVILDMIMPGMGGGETFDRLRELNPNVKVLLSSGYSLEGEATEIMARGCDGFIQKPFDPDALSEQIHKILDQE